jgi:hypothetical protein
MISAIIDVLGETLEGRFIWIPRAM